MFRVEATIAVSFWTTPKTDQPMALREVADIASCIVQHKRKMTLNGRIALYNYLNIRGFSWILPSNLFDVYQVMQCTKRSARPHMSQSCLCGNWLQAHHLDNPTVSGAWMGLAHGTSCAKGDPAWSDGPTELRTETVTSARTGAALTADNIWSRLAQSGRLCHPCFGPCLLWCLTTRGEKVWQNVPIFWWRPFQYPEGKRRKTDNGKLPRSQNLGQ